MKLIRHMTCDVMKIKSEKAKHITLCRKSPEIVNVQSLESILNVMTETGFETQFHATGYVKLSMITKVRTNE